MDYLKIALILSAVVTNVFLGFLTLSKNRRNVVNRTLAGFAGVFALWSLSLFFYEYPFILSSLIWIKITYLIVVFGIIGFMFYLGFVFPDGKDQPPVIGRLLYLILASALGYSILFTDSFVKEVISVPTGKQTILGFMYIPFIIYDSIFGFWGMGLLIKKYLHAKGRMKTQLKYLFSGVALFIATVLLLDSAIPLFTGDSRYFSISTVGSLFFVGFTVYAIIKHRLLDIRIALQEVMAFIFTTIILSTICYLGALTYWFVYKMPIKYEVIIVVTVVSILLNLFFNKIILLSRLIVGKLTNQPFYDFQKTVLNMSLNLNSTLEIKQLIDNLCNLFTNFLGVDDVAFVLKNVSQKDNYVTPKDHYTVMRKIGFNQELNFLDDGILVSYIERDPQVLILEEIGLLIENSNHETEKYYLRELYTHMEYSKVSLILPLVTHNQLLGIIALGSKKSGDPYTVQDTELLNVISLQASIALEKARLYKEVSEFNQNLQVRIDEATDELQKKNESLKQLDKMKDQLIAVTSHELRTPASNVQNYLWMTLTRPNPNTVLDPEDKERLQKSLTGIKNLVKLIADILDVSRIEGGKMEVKLQPTSYEAVVRSVIDELMPRAQRKNLSLTCSFTLNILPAVMADPTKLKEVLVNLITNAMKYTEQGGIIVSSAQKENEIIFSVKDTGRGIAQENIAKLFQKFYREDTSLSASNPETGGTGLGLYITKSIVELMHGRIWVESIQSQGSIFYFSLPATNAVVSPAVTSTKAFKGVFTREDYLRLKNVPVPSPSFVVPEPQNSKKKILLVEDEIEMRTFYSEFLSEKYEVDTAIDGTDGLSKLRLKHYDLVLLDVMMPGLNGVGFMQGEQQDPDTSKIPVILLTNLGEEETLSKCFDLGAKSMIMKSDVLPDQIIPVIEKEFQSPCPVV